MTDEHHADRRSFLRTGAIAGTALVAGASVMAQQVAADTDASNRGSPISRSSPSIPVGGRGIAAATLTQILETPSLIFRRRSRA
jgi:hypothetical protein